MFFRAGRTGNSRGKQAGPERVNESTAPLTTARPTLAHHLSKSHTNAPALPWLPQASENSYPKCLRKGPSQSSPSFPVCSTAWLPVTAPFSANQETQNSSATPTPGCFQLPWVELSGGVHMVLRQSTPDSFLIRQLCHSSQENK